MVDDELIEFKYSNPKPKIKPTKKIETAVGEDNCPICGTIFKKYGSPDASERPYVHFCLWID